MDATHERGIVITRVFAAPREHVFRAWTDPEWLASWWGPKIALLRTSAAAAVTVIRGMTDDQLARSGAVFADLPPMTVERLIVRGLSIHIDEHADSIRKTVGA